MLQSLVPPSARSSISGLFCFAYWAVGFGCGPLAVGALSDALRPRYGEDCLRFAMGIQSAALLWSSLHFWRVSRTLAEDYSVTKQGEAAWRRRWLPGVGSELLAPGTESARERP